MSFSLRDLFFSLLLVALIARDYGLRKDVEIEMARNRSAMRMFWAETGRIGVSVEKSNGHIAPLIQQLQGLAGDAHERIEKLESKVCE